MKPSDQKVRDGRVWPNVISINIAGPVGCGKSALLGEFRDVLQLHGYCVAIPDPGIRNDPPNGIQTSASHEIPRRDRTVVILTETAT
ncbi:MAG: hypothetical protein VX529_10645 [Pseudomonadota bacterium]|nr:hypothetical protein [Pseudomonadota bacterium]